MSSSGNTSEIKVIKDKIRKLKSDSLNLEIKNSIFISNLWQRYTSQSRNKHIIEPHDDVIILYENIFDDVL